MMNASKSGLMSSGCVVHIPCGRPGYTFSVPFLTSLAERSAESAIGTIWSSSPCRMSTGTVMAFSCGATPVTVTGSVLVPVPANKMARSATLKFVAKSGKQKPEKFEGTPADVLKVAVDGGALVQAGLTLTTVQSNEEKIEANTVI